jgi:hypothetical protein
MDLGLHLGVKLINSVSGILWNGDSTNIAIDAIASFDLRKITSAPPAHRGRGLRPPRVPPLVEGQ